MAIRRRTQITTPEAAQEPDGMYKYIPESMEQFAVPMNEIRLDPSNPRKNDDAAQKLAKLIEYHGFRKPIVVDQNGIIRAGNTAYKAAKILGMDRIPIIRHEFSSEADAIAYSISDNKASEFSDWDDEILFQLRKSDMLSGPDVLGFSKKEWKELEMSDVPPENLQPVDIEGDSREQGEFIIIRFADATEMAEFKQRAGMAKFERAIDYGTLLTALEAPSF